jgi:hypothetical protein
VSNSTMSDLPYALSWLSPNRWLVEDLFYCQNHALPAVYRLPSTWFVRYHCLMLVFIYKFMIQSRKYRSSISSEPSLTFVPRYADKSDNLLAYTVTLSYGEPWVAYYDFNYPSPVGWNVLMNFWFGFMARLLAFNSLCFCNRDKMAKSSLLVAVIRSLNNSLQVL